VIRCPARVVGPPFPGVSGSRPGELESGNSISVRFIASVFKLE
jgi:hypothetical protein